MSQPNSAPPREPSFWKTVGKYVSAAFGQIGYALFHNWPSKLLSLVLAVGLWAGLITQDPTLTRERSFTDVSVSVSGEDSLKRNGFIVTSDLDALLDDVSISVDVPQMQYASVQANNYNVRIDLSRIREAGTQQVRIMSTNSSTYGTVSSVTPATVQVEVDEYVTRYRIPVTVKTTGEMAEGFYAEAPAFEPNTVAVSGPKKLVDMIDHVECVADQAVLPGREGMVRRAIPFMLVDVKGNEIKSDLLQVTSESVLLDSIVVEQTIYAMVSIDMAEMGLVRGEPADGYEIRSVHITPSTVMVAGRKSVLDGLDLLYATSYIDVTNMKSSVTQSLRVRQPVQLAHISTSEIMVSVEIAPIIKTATFENIPIRIHGMSDAYTVTLSPETSYGTVHVTGEGIWLDTLYARNFELSCDVAHLSPGTYELSLTCKVKDDEGQSYTYEIVPTMARVTIAKIEEVTETTENE